ncbi:nucleoside triphosphate pyrophosphohydrolase [Falsirhodobacter halotolerans]|uniref:nucleoside triphosphate pyrophosphohydrolase n=1 Tax=Falsirhodobacter halotolerans TaxID=1146892 RepID=UPI001FCFD95E|nr:nucleoside triphosphate pyrophosphohydrolase [Falsirhodobacter halotolerans]MCJ8139720.1 nucleoside triphosphate pyrophosphohydrolase [Falsirhodobacter halotolerans]
MRAETEIRRLLDIMARLRDPVGGCPWDVEQTFDTIAPYTIEEAYEVADAIARHDWGGLPGELGDLLLQTVFHARIAEEQGRFDFADVAAAIGDKMIARHPHVFADAAPRDAEAQRADWDRLKEHERAARDQTGILDDVALALPALTRAVKLQARAARVGFDWPSTDQVLEKMREEMDELDEARARDNHDDMTEEFGDLMFVMANLARHLRIDPEAALRAANEKFIRRFSYIEHTLKANGRRPQDSDLAEMDALWNEAKLQE